MSNYEATVGTTTHAIKLLSFLADSPYPRGLEREGCYTYPYSAFREYTLQKKHSQLFKDEISKDVASRYLQLTKIPA